jgi:hypothetical protein
MSWLPHHPRAKPTWHRFQQRRNDVELGRNSTTAPSSAVTTGSVRMIRDYGQTIPEATLASVRNAAARPW